MKQMLLCIDLLEYGYYRLGDYFWEGYTILPQNASFCGNSINRQGRITFPTSRPLMDDNDTLRLKRGDHTILSYCDQNY